MRLAVPRSFLRPLIALALIVVAGFALGSRWWPVGGEATSAIRVTYHYDYDETEGLVMRGQREECDASWPVGTMDVSWRESILTLAAEDGIWVWSGSSDAWRASGLPDPCAGQLLSDG